MYSTALLVLTVVLLCLHGCLFALAMERNDPVDKQVKLTILQWNCRSVNLNLHYLIQHINQNGCQVICLQSPNCSFKQLPKIEGYFYPPVTERINNTVDKVYTATYIKIEILHEILSSPILVHPTQPIFSNSVCVTFQTKKIKILNLYAPKSIHPQGLSWLESLDLGGWIVAGDFNIHHSMWCKNFKGASPAVEQAESIMNSNLILLNNGELTRVPDVANHSPSAIDLTLVSPDIHSDVAWTIGDDSLGSDHLPITIEYEVGFTETQNTLPRAPKYFYDRANWKEFHSYIQNNIKQDNPLEVDAFCEEVVQLIISAANVAIPRSRGAPAGKPANPWWTPECDLAVKSKKKLHYIWKKLRNHPNFILMKEAKIHCNKIIAKAKLLYFQNKVTQEIQDPTDIGRAWKLVNKLKNKYNPSPVPLVHQGNKVSNDVDKAELLASTFAGVSTTGNLPLVEKLVIWV